MKIVLLLNSIFTRFFPLWIIIFSVFSFYFPSGFEGLRSLIIPTLAVIMLGMGMTLELNDFKSVFRHPAGIATGIVTQYTVMPFAGYILATLFDLNPLLSAGIVLLGSCPGGTASNVITYLAKGDVALSVSITAVSTLLCPVMIPVLTYIFANKWIDVPVYKLFLTSLQIVLAPVLTGLIIRSLLKEKLNSFLEIMPSVSSAAIIFIVAVIVAINSGSIKSLGLVVFISVIIHNSLGLAAGYTAAKLAGLDKFSSKALAFEVGMQNSGLAVALASAHFGALAALPGALFSVWHNVTGSAIASYWRQERKNNA